MKGGIQLSNKLFSDEEINILKENPNVVKVTRRTIEFSDEFKIRALAEYNKGKSARKIFTESGLSVESIGINRVRGFIQRISKAQELPKLHAEKYSSMQQYTKKLERRITYLQQENEFLKKIQESEKKK